MPADRWRRYRRVRGLRRTGRKAVGWAPAACGTHLCLWAHQAGLGLAALPVLGQQMAVMSHRRRGQRPDAGARRYSWRVAWYVAPALTLARPAPAEPRSRSQWSSSRSARHRRAMNLSPRASRSLIPPHHPPRRALMRYGSTVVIPATQPPASTERAGRISRSGISSGSLTAPSPGGISVVASKGWPGTPAGQRLTLCSRHAEPMVRQRKDGRRAAAFLARLRMKGAGAWRGLRSRQYCRHCPARAYCASSGKIAAQRA